jgi:drug/metabolite transporter (DMT)-like permease
VFLWAGNFVLAERALREMTPIAFSAVRLIAAPAMAGVSWQTLSGWMWIAILLGGSIGVGMGQWAKLRSMRVLGPTRVILYGNLVLLVTLALASLTLGTRPTSVELAVGALIVLGSVCLHVLDTAPRLTELGKPEPSIAEAVIEDL